MKTLALIIATLLAVTYAVWGVRGIELTVALLIPVTATALITWRSHTRVPLAIPVGSLVGLTPALVLAVLAFLFDQHDRETTREAGAIIVLIVYGVPLVVTGGIGGLIGGSFADRRVRPASGA